jgi:hypothetical protein
MSPPKPLVKVLRYSENPPNRATVRKYYALYRAESNIPKRCDNAICIFHTQPLMWNTLPLEVILDHIDGCPENSSPNNLRYLCPNCDSQQTATRCGANQGRVQDRGEHGYSRVERGSQDKHCKVFDGGTGCDQGIGRPQPTEEDGQIGE